MIRVVYFLIVVGVLALGAAWLADRPGDVIVTWQGMRIKTSPLVMAAALLVAVAVLVFIWSIVRAIVRSPSVLAKRQRERRGARAYQAISHGLIAVGSGDIDAARKHSSEVNRLAPDEPLALLLSAQAAQLSGDRDGAERAFRAMAKPRRHQGARPAWPVHRSAPPRRSRKRASPRRRSRAHRAHARLGRPRGVGGALQGRRLGRRAGALGTPSRRDGQSELSPPARGAADGARARYRKFRPRGAPRPPRSKPTSLRRPWCRRRRSPRAFWPRAAICARPTASSTPPGAPIRIPNWRKAYAELRAGESARDRLKRIDALAKRAPGNVEGALAVARAAIDAREFARARAALAPYLAHRPSASPC